MSLSVQMRRPFVIVNDDAGIINRGIELLAQGETAADRAEAASGFATRAALVSVIAGGLAPIAGATYRAAGVEYLGQSGATSIPDMPGLVPSGEITPQHWGALGNGAADDTAAIQAAINYCEPVGTVTGLGGKELVFPAGTYRYTNLIIRRPFKIRARGSVELKALAGVTGDTVLIEPIHDGTNYVSNGGTFARLEITGIQFSGFSKADAGAANGIAFRRAASNEIYTEVIMTNCEAWSFANDGIVGQNFHGLVKFNECQIHNNARDNFNINSCADWRWDQSEIGVAGRDNILMSGCVEMRGFGTYVYAAARYNFYLFNAAGSWHGGANDTAEDHGIYYDNRLAGRWFEFLECGHRFNSGSAANTFADVFVTSLANSELILTSPSFEEPNAGFALKNIQIAGAATVRVVNPRFNSGAGITDPDFASPAAQVRLHNTPQLFQADGVNFSRVPFDVVTATQFAGLSGRNGAGHTAYTLSGWDATNRGGVLQLLNPDNSLGQRLAAPGAGGTLTAITFPGPYANDAAAASAGIAVGVAYRVTGGGIAWRQV
jgi:hypothetical protein